MANHQLEKRRRDLSSPWSSHISWKQIKKKKVSIISKLPEVFKEKLQGAGRPFLWVQGLSSWDDFNEHPEWDPSGAVLGGQNGLRKQMALEPLAIWWSICWEESEARDEERVKQRKKHQSPDSDIRCAPLKKKPLGTVICWKFYLSFAAPLPYSILMFSVYLNVECKLIKWDLRFVLQDPFGNDTLLIRLVTITKAC